MNIVAVVSGRQRNLIFLLLMLIIIIGLLIAWPLISRENATLMEDSQKYAHLHQLMQISDYAQAGSLCADLLQRHSYSYQLKWYYGRCMASQGKWKEAGNYLEQARQIRPALVTDQVFLVQFGEVLYHLGDYTRARRYLSESLKYKQPELTAIAKQLLQQMDTAGFDS